MSYNGSNFSDRSLHHNPLFTSPPQSRYHNPHPASRPPLVDNHTNIDLTPELHQQRPFVHPSTGQQSPLVLQTPFTPVSPRPSFDGRLLSPSPSPLLSSSPYYDVSTRAWSAIPETSMSKRQHTGQLRQIAPTFVPEPVRRATSAAPSTTTDPLAPAGVKLSLFWVQEGMDTFIDWFTDPHNYARLQKKNPVAGQKQSDLHKEIRQLVNSKHGTSWTESQVKSKITYVKKKYREAVALNSTGEGPVLQRQEAICPLFVRLHTVLGASLSANPPPPRQSGSRGEDIVSSDDSEEDTSDVETADRDSETTSQAESSTSVPVDTEHPIKRRKREGLTPFALNSSIDKMQQFAEQAKAEMRSREQAIESRERNLAEKLLRMSDEANKRAEEARILLRQELAAERAEFKKEMAEEREDLKRERADLKRDRAQFMEEREALKAENSALKKELELNERFHLKNKN